MRWHEATRRKGKLICFLIEGKPSEDILICWMAREAKNWGTIAEEGKREADSQVSEMIKKAHRNGDGKKIAAFLGKQKPENRLLILI